MQPQKPRPKTSLTFDDQDIIHQYNRKGHGGTVHMTRLHEQLSVPYHPDEDDDDDNKIGDGASPDHQSSRDSSIRIVTQQTLGEEKKSSIFDTNPFKSFRKSSADTLKSPTTPIHLGDPRSLLSTEMTMFPPRSEDITDNGTTRSPTDPQSNKSFSRPGSFANLFERFGHHHSSDSDDHPKSPRSPRDDDMKRGGAHRGTRDYPHLQKKDRAQDQEMEERRALVAQADQSDEDDGEVGSSPDQDVRKTPLPLSRSGSHSRSSTPTPAPEPALVTTGLRRLPNVPDMRQDPVQYPLPRSS